MNRIIVDWGTSNFRAYRFDAGGRLVEEHQAAAGILAVADGAFEAALMREIGGWIAPESEVMLSGMITSRNGWVETPYVETPATLQALAERAVERRLANGARLRFLPGVAARRPSPDVMRGEEIQVFGAVGEAESAVLVHPGTHCKWVRVEEGAIVGFRTFMTGEVYGVMRRHSILGRLIPQEGSDFDSAAFEAGVRRAAASDSAGLLNDLFTTRSGALLGDFPPAEIADRLSGLLIGHEVVSGLALGWGAQPPILFGDAELCRRYALAFGILGVAPRSGPEQATVAGFARLSRLRARNGAPS